MSVPVTIYTMSNCSYCERAKALLKQRGVAFTEIHVDLNDEPQWRALHARTGLRTMPQIFSGDSVIGGYSDLAALDSKDGLVSLK